LHFGVHVCIQDELRDAFARLTGSSVGGATLTRLTKFLDKDQDGAIDRLEFREGLQSFARYQKAGAFDEDSDSDLDEFDASPEDLKKALLRPINE
jgi:hypothetical protein